ncbi:MAG: hypothetical protein IBX44_07335 [Sulfurospirillum sp.]|nr:hypothetical protein [Sulfurospirillum sp.]
MKKLLIPIVPFLFSGCLYVNDRGIDTHYYNTCKEYYDSMGVYHKQCDENLLEFQSIKNETAQIIDETKKLFKESK